MKTVIEIRDAISSGKVTAVEVVQSSLDLIAAYDDKVGAFLEVFSDESLEAAKAIDAKKTAGDELPRLAGVPIALKDNLCYAGHTTSNGSVILKEYVAPYTATAVQRLIDAGAIIIGRTNMDDAAMGTSTETSAFQLTKNPWDDSKVPGGSSGGSAAAVTMGFVPAALGSDTGGSVRQPASLCGVTGFKPTYGRVSRYGLIANTSSFDVIGPIARTAEGAALILEVMQGKDVQDATTIISEEVEVVELMSKDVKGLKIGVPKEYFIDAMDPAVRKLVEDAIDMFKTHGAEIHQISLPLTEYALPAYYVINPAEIASNTGRLDGMRYGTRAKGSLMESYFAARGEGFGTEVKRRILIGNFVLSAGYDGQFYKKAQAVRTEVTNEFDRAFKEVDVIISPTSPTVAWDIGAKFNDPIAMYMADIFTVTANIAGIPAISVPCGMASDLPVGLQIFAARGEDTKVLGVAAAYQSFTKWHENSPELSAG
jgi:aspartyl-tRNA(Asn)/glutamyl-tRNA(Gln) amidotransferase subunit A